MRAHGYISGQGVMHTNKIMTVPAKQITYQSELARKSIHLASVLIPIIYLQIGHRAGIITLCVMTFVSLLFGCVDALSHHNTFNNVKGGWKMLRQHEKRSDKFYLTGASWVLIAATMCFSHFSYNCSDYGIYNFNRM